jgi:RNA polymerase sigma factor (sigma-70 family)
MHARGRPRERNYRAATVSMSPRIRLAGVLLQGQMEVSALRYSGAAGLHGRSALLRLQSDERLIAVIRRGNPAGFEVLVSRYQSRLLAFCRHLLGSREDAEDVLQEVLAAAFNAILADGRPINVRPWLYRIARNRCLNHLRRIQAVGVDSMDVHLSDHGASTADKVHKLEEFRMLVGDINELPETQKTALVLREMDALSYEQIAEAMETTVPSVKSLLVRARMSLAEAAEARMLSCDDVRIELAEVAEGLQRRPGPLVRRHLRACKRCSMFQVQLKETNKALTALLPIGPMVLLKKLALTHLGHSAGAGAGAGSGASGAGAAGQAAALSTTAAAGAAVGPSAGGLLSAGVGAIATKAAAGLAAAALVTAGAVEVSHTTRPRVAPLHPTATARYHSTLALASASRAVLQPAPAHHRHAAAIHRPPTKPAATTTTPTTKPPAAATDKHHAKGAVGAHADKTATSKTAKPSPPPPPPPGRTQSQTQTTVLPSSSSSGTTTDPSTTPTTTESTTTTAAPTTTTSSGGSGTETSGQTDTSGGTSTDSGAGSGDPASASQTPGGQTGGSGSTG